MILGGRRSIRRRRGLVMAEAGIVYSLTLLLIIGAIVVGLGIFRYQQIAWLAREGARWAAVRGPTYQSEKGQSAPTAATVLANAVTPKGVALQANSLTATLTYDTLSTPQTVTFRLNYRWVPETFLAPITFTSTSIRVIMY